MSVNFNTTAINLVGIKLGPEVNVVMVLLQLLVIAAFVTFSTKAVMNGMGEKTLVSMSPFYNSHVPMRFVLSGGAVACYSFLGFDAVSTFVEEAVDPLKNIPRVIVLTTVIGGVIFIIATYTCHLAHPGYSYKDAIVFLVCSIIGTFSYFYLLTNLDRGALILGCSWAAIGFIYLIFLTKGFKIAPPEMSSGGSH